MENRDATDLVEAAFLADPRIAAGRQCMELTLATLAAQGWLSFADSKRRGDRLVLGEGPAGARPADHATAVIEALRNAGAEQGLPVREAKRALQLTFGPRYGRWLHDCLAPPLIERGMLYRESSKRFGLFTQLRYRASGRGQEEAQAFVHLREELSTLPSLVQSEPQRAVHIVLAAGPLLAHSQLRPALGSLRKSLKQPTSLRSSSRRADLLDLIDAATALELDWLLGLAESVSAMSGSGSFGSDGDGGGDGGGGD